MHLALRSVRLRRADRGRLIRPPGGAKNIYTVNVDRRADACSGGKMKIVHQTEHSDTGKSSAFLTLRFRSVLVSRTRLLVLGVSGKQRRIRIFDSGPPHFIKIYKI